MVVDYIDKSTHTSGRLSGSSTTQQAARVSQSNQSVSRHLGHLTI